MPTSSAATDTTRQKHRIPKHVSPLTASTETTADKGKGTIQKKQKGQQQQQQHHHQQPSKAADLKHPKKKSQKRARKEALEDLEEQRLTSLLFSSGVEPTITAEVDEPSSKLNLRKAGLSKEKDHEQPEDDSNLAFEIDRSGRDGILHVDDEDDLSKEIVLKTSKVGRSDDDGDDYSEDDDDEEHVEGDQPAWIDEDDDGLAVNIVDSSKRLRKLRKSRDEEGATALSGKEFERRLRKRYEDTTQVTARTDWARLEPKPKRSANRDMDDDAGMEEEIGMLGSTSAPLFATSRQRLAPNVINMMRCPDANQADPNKAVVQAVNFHPSSDPDRPLLLTAGLDKTLRFFQVGTEKSEKIHGIHCKFNEPCSLVLSCRCFFTHRVSFRSPEIANLQRVILGRFG